MKIKTFLVSSRESEAFNWALGFFALATVMGCVDHWYTDTTVEGFFSTIREFQDTNPITIAEALIGICSSLTMWEILRRSLVKDGKFWLSIALVVIMVLSLLAVVIGLPVWGGDQIVASAGTVKQTAFSLFQSRFVHLSDSFIVLAKVVLGVLMGVKYAGRLRFYGFWLFLAPLLSGLVYTVVHYLYYSVAGLTMGEIASYANMGSVAQVAFALLPMVFLRMALKNND